MASGVFSEPPRRADSKNPIFIFCRILGLGHLRGPGFSLGRILGVLSIEPFFLGRVPSQGGSIDHAIRNSCVCTTSTAQSKAEMQSKSRRIKLFTDMS